ncbi:acetyltransferase (GNAT) family protein [Salsuginibacillus halophilus]|uniref:Acetyltransferase (GNAT) family protein n=1 Tax=Salsuginibacillus halophilus TaxID=517424 RepID=A0A2P8HE64_9BACI|nr:GNAT family N-acetyltransferase [Salsuginibacillus halophilus]PSL44502.1 acetyltransferase (GNAT) family protein [Salsuginibacillus halophilus]
MSHSKVEITELTEKEQWLEAFPIMNQLRTDLTQKTYLELLKKMRKDGYTLYALYEDDRMVSLAGLSFKVNFYNKRHVFVYDLVTDSAYRSKGYGEKLLNHLHEWAKENGAEYIALESGIQRTDAHRLYEEKFDYDKWCYSFRKKL